MLTVVQVLLVPLLALIGGLAQGPIRCPALIFGQVYSFAIPVSDANNIKLVSKPTSGEIAPGIRLEENGLLEGKPTNAGTFTFTIAVLWAPWDSSELTHNRLAEQPGRR